ncbi:hypothetical protein BDN70DRAFT_931595 [Pholiota conissans]|uniref:Uncharacterized protein n=1 Tax=Pholiota conissans TaxID=109636 RepID=A0A9P5Z5T1_9AGAR|nr:hypothetical protein BDN70DRAFT_931595 [Pholiota conissans]
MSRHLLKSRWAWIAREHIQKHLTRSRRFSTAIQQPTLSLRHSHSFADPDVPTRTFPIDIIDHQNTVRMFDAALTSGEYETAKEILLDLVDRHAVDSSNMDIFRQLRAVIIRSEKPSINMLLELGLALASKGYTDFVRDEIGPDVEDYGSGQVFSRFQAVIATLEKTRQKPTGSLVFEDASEDYSNVLSRFPLPPPSIMELIDQLSPLLPDQSADDKSIFEEENDEYSLYTPSHTAEYSSNPSAEKLLELLKAESFERALELLNEMQIINTPIPPSPLYEIASLNVLRNATLSPADKLDQFTKWFSLVLPRHAVTPAPDFVELRYLVLQSPNSHLELMKRCAMILASKGYGHNRLKYFLKPIFIHLPAAEVMNFIHELERRDRDYWLEQIPVSALLRTRRTSANIRGAALASLTYLGHIDEAIALITEKDTPIFPLHVYDILLRKLETTPKREYRNYIHFVDYLRSQRIEIEVAQGKRVPLPRHFPSLSDVLPAPADPTHLPSVLRYLRKAILLQDTHRILPALLTNFMEDYLKTGRSLALHLLLTKALRKSHRAVKLLVFAEMRLYRQFQQFDLVIKTFGQHFYIAGVPRDKVVGWYNNVQGHAENNGEGLSRVSGFHLHTLLAGGKLWPDLEQCNLVWEALIIIANRDKPALRRLYEQFIAYASHLSDPSRHLVDVDPLPVTTRFGLPVSGETFHAFMHHLLPFFGPEFGEKVIEDMWRLGLWPGKFHYGTLARHYADRGNLLQVFTIIDDLESGAVLQNRPQKPVSQQEKHGAAVDESSSVDASSPTKVPLFMQPDPPFYINIMQGLIYSTNLDAAEEVHRRLQQRFSCPPGSYAPLDRALKKLDDLKVLLASEGSTKSNPTM